MIKPYPESFHKTQEIEPGERRTIPPHPIPPHKIKRSVYLVQTGVAEDHIIRVQL